MILGRIVRLCCREGETVREGDMLIELESDELKAAVATAVAAVEKSRADIAVYASAIEGARANMTSAEADLQTARADVVKAQAKLAEAQRELDRANALYQKRIIAKADLDVVVTAHETAVADTAAARARLAAASARKTVVVAQLEPQGLAPHWHHQRDQPLRRFCHPARCLPGQTGHQNLTGA
jgi:HlyD family secretion protein